MPRKPSDPKYRLHKQSGQAIVTLSDGMGGRKDVLLGNYGTPESWEKYGREISEWKANGCRLFTTAKPTDLTIAELVSAYYVHAEKNYPNPDVVENIRLACRPLYHLYAQTLARDFGPRALKAVRQLMIDGYKHSRHGEQKPLARNTINRRIGRIKHLFRWAESEEMIPPSTRHALDTVAGLLRDRSSARETEPVRPVHADLVRGTLAFMPPIVADMVGLQELTGMRSGELVRMRALDLDTTGKVWLYRPGSDKGKHGEHKTAHLGHGKVIAIGPKGQAIIRKYLRTDLQAYLFSPAETTALFRAQQRANRKTKVQPSQRDRKKRAPKRKPGARYTVGTYRQAIGRGCDKAFPPPDGLSPEELKAWRKANHWFPHQLRHSLATEIRREYGIDAARAVLGHRSPAITETYAELDQKQAERIMERLG